MSELSEQCKKYMKYLNTKKFDEKKPKKLSGYNIFCKENRPKMKGNTTIEIMVELGGKWKGLSDKEKENYKKKSEKENKKASESFDYNDNDEQVKELRNLMIDLLKTFKKSVKDKEVEAEESESDSDESDDESDEEKADEEKADEAGDEDEE